MFLASLVIALTIPEQTAFKPLFKNPDIEIALAASPKEPWINASHSLPVSGETIFALLTDFSRYETTFAGSVKSVKVLEKGDDFVRLHIIWPLPFPMRNRDAVVKYTYRKVENQYLISWKHDAKSDDPTEGLRIEEVAGQTVITPVEASKTPQSNLTYTYYADLGGSLPAFIKEGSYIEEPVVYFNAVRKYFSLAPISGK
jgi:hypothetical protein